MVKRVSLIFAMCLIILGGMTTVAASGAKTASPNDVSPYSMFDPNFEYLENGTAEIINEGNGSIIIDGQTDAKRYVSTIGIKLTLQQWNGSSWTDYDVGQEITISNESFIYVSTKKNVPTGYYYRVRSVHWTIEDGIREQGERYTSSFLVN